MSRVGAVSEADAVFAATGIVARSLRIGNRAPDVTLPDASGKPVRLSDVWCRGPLVIVFYRGGWCTYCSLQLREWQQYMDALNRLDATLLAISPQMPEHSMRTAEENALGFTVLSDCALEAASGFGIAYTLHPDVVDYYGSVGTDIPVLNGNGLWVLPVPATYVIDSAGGIRFVSIEEDVRKRPQPREVIATLEALRQQG